MSIWDSLARKRVLFGSWFSDICGLELQDGLCFGLD